MERIGFHSRGLSLMPMNANSNLLILGLYMVKSHCFLSEFLEFNSNIQMAM